MTEVVVQEQLQLECLVEVVQTKLVRNFSLLSKRLRQSELHLQSHADNHQQALKETRESIDQLATALREQEQRQQRAIDVLVERIERMEDRQKAANEESKELPVALKRVNDQLFNTQLQFEQKTKTRDRQYSDLAKQVQSLAVEQSHLQDEVSTKENKVQVERIGKEIEVLKDKHHHLQGELKLANHKIQKIEILNEKAERQQAKKELAIFKEIQERVKKQIKINNAPASNRPSNAYIQNIQNINNAPLQNIQNIPNNSGNDRTATETRTSGVGQSFSLDAPEEMATSTTRRVQSLLDEDQIMQRAVLGDTARKEELEHIIERWSEKMKYFQIQLKEVNQNLKILNKTSSHHKKGEGNKENSAVTEAFKDRLNEIKPEIVKLWAKLDTIEDRLGFSERKTEEKLKGINQLATLVKENNVSRLDEKLKLLQTEIFTSLKEVKSKVEGKVGQAEHDKHRQQVEDKIGQLNDLIYLKSDKLEVKKALLFLESKIKEIILVISEDEENEKDALLTKKQLKCISCDKEVEKVSGVVSSPKGNWDSLPFKDHPPEILGRFGMTNFGSLAKKIKKLESKDLPLLNKRNPNQSFQNSS